MSEKIIKAKFPGNCRLTGFKISVGDLVAWTPGIPGVVKVCVVYPNTDYKNAVWNGGQIFKYVEACFDNWFEGLQDWLKEPYVGWGEDEPACYSKSGAITQAIEEMIDEAEKSGKPVYVHRFDYEGIFQP